MEPLTKNECEIMNLFWSAGRPLSRSDIIELSPQKSWKEKSIHILLNSLLAKGAIQVDGFVSTKTNYGRTFRPCLTQEAYAAALFQVGGHTVKMNAAKLLSALREVGEIDEATESEGFLDLAAALVRGDRMDDKTIRRLEEVLAQRRRELDGAQEEK